MLAAAAHRTRRRSTLYMHYISSVSSLESSLPAPVRSYAASDPHPRDTFLQLSLFMELDQQVFTILRQSVHSTREPVHLRPEQVVFLFAYL